MAKKEKRFEVVYKDGSQLADEGYRQILVDKETGVNYLSWKSGYGAGITPQSLSDSVHMNRVREFFIIQDICFSQTPLFFF